VIEHERAILKRLIDPSRRTKRFTIYGTKDVNRKTACCR